VSGDSQERAAEALHRLASNRFDEEAWRTLFNLLWPFAVAVCARLHGGDTSSAQDAAQESLVRLARYAPFKDLHTLEVARAYLRTVCRRVVHSYYAQQDTQLSVTTDMTALLASDDLDPEQELGAKLLFETILEKLEDDDRKVLRMTVAGYSLTEIANELQIEYNAAGLRVHRLRNRVRKWLQHL
jgi:RNA polymerase sigma factor (sigma-70 family)